MALLSHLRYGRNSYSQLTVTDERIEGIKPFTPVYTNKPSGLRVYLWCFSPQLRHGTYYILNDVGYIPHNYGMHGWWRQKTCLRLRCTI